MKWLIRVAVIASMGLCIGSEIYLNNGPRSSDRLVRVYDYWDTTLRKKAEPGRGVFVRFNNFPSGNFGEAYAQSIYYRAVYALYPLPVVVTRPGVVVNEGKDFLKDNTYPSEQWLADHGVGSVFTVRFEPKMDRPFLTVESVQWLPD